MSGLVLFVTDVLHPIDNLSVFLFLNGDVRHGRRRCCAVPMLLSGREPNDISGPDLLDRAAPSLRPAAAGRDDESLTERMRVPCRPRARLKGYAGALNKCRIGRLKSGSIRTVPVNQSAGPLPEGCEPALFISKF
jgi:hypothetical protein